MSSTRSKISLQEIDDQAFLLAMQLSTINILPAVINAAIELNLFEIIAKGNSHGASMTPSEIASHLPIQNPNLPRKLERMLRLLASHSLLTCSSLPGEDGTIERLYGLSSAGKYFVRDDDGYSMALCSVLFNHPTLTKVWLKGKDTILEDDNDLFKKVHGMPMFNYMETDPELSKIFKSAMTDLSSIQMKKVLQVYKGFEHISTLTDVGGGIGSSLNMIVSKYPSIKAINFDLPQVIQNAPSYPGIEHVGGDMFESVPKSEHAIMIKSICHDWDDEKCLQLLRNCQKALPENGMVIVIDMIMPEAPESTIAAKCVSTRDNLLSFFRTGGRERTKREFEALCKCSGFSTFQLVCCAFSILGVMEFSK